MNSLFSVYGRHSSFFFAALLLFGQMGCYIKVIEFLITNNWQIFMMI